MSNARHPIYAYLTRCAVGPELNELLDGEDADKILDAAA